MREGRKEGRNRRERNKRIESRVRAGRVRMDSGVLSSLLISTQKLCRKAHPDYHRVRCFNLLGKRLDQTERSPPSPTQLGNIKQT